MQISSNLSLNKEIANGIWQMANGLLSDNKEIANGFCRFFAEISKRIKASVFSISAASSIWKYHDNTCLTGKLNPARSRFIFQRTSPRDIFNILKSLKRKKSSGYDEIPASLIIDGAGVLCEPLSYMINRSLDNSLFPESEKCAKITPIYKSGERSEMDNYRPISVLPVLSKVIERVVYKHLYDYLWKSHLLTDNQFGFRRGSSTEHAVTFLTDSIRMNIDKGYLTGAVFIDLRKAFDTVDHARLLSKLPAYGIIGKELRWLESYLFNRKHFVVFDRIRSDVKSINCGVPQGSILGPILFSLLINDIGLQLEKCSVILYADDTVIFASGKNSAVVAEKLNHDLVTLGNFFNDNSLVVNFKQSKTEFLLFGSNKRLSRNNTVNITMNGEKICETESYKYLGMTLDKNLNLQSHVHNIHKKVASRIKLLGRIRIDITPVVAETIYKVMILPILLYCSNMKISIPDSQKLKIEKVQHRALKIINGRHGRITFPAIKAIKDKRCAIEVFKCVHGLAPNLFENYFCKQNHTKGTRGNNVNLVVPPIRTEAARKTFFYQGTQIYNKLPTTLKTETSILRFKTSFEAL